MSKRPPYLPPVLWRVATSGTGRGYNSPHGKTYASERVAREYAEQAQRRGCAVRLYRTEPVWQEVPLDEQPNP